MYFFKPGDEVVFTKAWTPVMAPDDPFFIEPVAQGTHAFITEVADNHVRIKFFDTDKWPKPVILWKPGTFPDQIDDGYDSLAKLAN